MALQFASPKLQADRSIVLAAVQSDGMAREFASLKLQADRSIVLAAVQSDGTWLFNSLLQNYRLIATFMLAAVQNDGDALRLYPNLCGAKVR